MSVLPKTYPDTKYLEYPEYIQLTGFESIYINVPMTLVKNIELSAKRIASFIYCRKRMTLERDFSISIVDLASWCGYKPDRHANRINQKMLESIKELEAEEFIDLNQIPSINSSVVKGVFNTDKSYNECTYGFSVLYLDEIEKIVNCKISGITKYFNIPVILLVFTYIRGSIFRRPNKLGHLDRNTDGTNNTEYDIQRRREKFPEAYSSSFIEIAKELGITADAVSKAVTVLEELNLIKVSRAYSYYIGKNKKGKDVYQTPYSIFANAYKRESSHLLDAGLTYADNEIKRKEKLMQQYNSKYKRKE